jgi:hypothetical protein
MMACGSVRTCQFCNRGFVASDRFEQYCGPCRRELVDDRSVERGRRRLTGALFLILLPLVGVLVETFTGLWSWGYGQMQAHAPERMPGQRGDQGRALVLAVYVVPALGLTVLLAGGIAWSVGMLYRACRSGDE